MSSTGMASTIKSMKTLGHCGWKATTLHELSMTWDVKSAFRPRFRPRSSANRKYWHPPGCINRSIARVSHWYYGRYCSGWLEMPPNGMAKPPAGRVPAGKDPLRGDVRSPANLAERRVTSRNSPYVAENARVIRSRGWPAATQ